LNISQLFLILFYTNNWMICFWWLKSFWFCYDAVIRVSHVKHIQILNRVWVTKCHLAKCRIPRVLVLLYRILIRIIYLIFIWLRRCIFIGWFNFIGFKLFSNNTMMLMISNCWVFQNNLLRWLFTVSHCSKSKCTSFSCINLGFCIFYFSNLD